MLPSWILTDLTQGEMILKRDVLFLFFATYKTLEGGDSVHGRLFYRDANALTKATNLLKNNITVFILQNCCARRSIVVQDFYK